MRIRSKKEFRCQTPMYVWMNGTFRTNVKSTPADAMIKSAWSEFSIEIASETIRSGSKQNIDGGDIRHGRNRWPTSESLTRVSIAASSIWGAGTIDLLEPMMPACPTVPEQRGRRCESSIVAERGSDGAAAALFSKSHGAPLVDDRRVLSGVIFWERKRLR